VYPKWFSRFPRFPVIYISKQKVSWKGSENFVSFPDGVIDFEDFEERLSREKFVLRWEKVVGC
jgi:hypothetical protein